MRAGEPIGLAAPTGGVAAMEVDMVQMDRRGLLLGFSALAVAGMGRGPLAIAQGKIKPGSDAVLLVTDVQNCFLPGGSLAVKDGDQVIPVINRIAGAFENVIMTQDWHTPGHVSFASSHAGKKPFDVVRLP